MTDLAWPVVKSPQLLAKPGEHVHFEIPAATTKTVVDRRSVGGGSVSVPLGFGVRSRVGTRRRSVVTGQHLEVADRGVLSITSQRAVFLGQSKTIECPYARLARVSVFDGGIEIALTNRKPDRFHVDDAASVAKVIQAAARRQP